MTTPNVQPEEQPDHFAEIANELHLAADDIAKLAGSGLPKPRQFALNIQPGLRDNDDVTAAAVDAMAGALLGVSGQVHRMGDGSYHYGTDHLTRGPLKVVIYQGVSTEWALKNDVAAAEAELAEREAELKKARARVAELRAARGPVGLKTDAAGLDYTRADTEDDPTPVSPARVPLHTGSVVNGDQLVVDEAPVHLDFDDGASACGLAPTSPHTGVVGWDEVTCTDCFDQAPF